VTHPMTLSALWTRMTNLFNVSLFFLGLSE
jgi:hypothetical protein